MPDISKRKNFAIHESNGFRCHYCGRRYHPSFLHVDHIVPRSAGGSIRPDNLTTACITCNCMKGDLSVDAFMEKVERKHIFHESQAGYFASILRIHATRQKEAPDVRQVV